MRSAAVNIGLVGVLAFAMSGCANANSTNERRCVDRTSDTVVGDEHCANSSGGGSHGWYYGGRANRGRVSGGSYTAPSGVDSGGFGESGRSRGTGG
jgi:hypothetical protein